MKKIVTTLIATLFVSAAFAEGNVEKAKRFRAQQTDSPAVQATAATLSAVSPKDTPDSRYALAHSSAAQITDCND